MEINRQAPVVQEAAIEIAAPPAAVWKLLSELEKWPSWQPRIAYARAGAPPAPGLPFRWKVNGTPIASVFQVVQPREALGWTGRTLGASAIHTWRIRPTAEGCRVEVAESMDGWLVRLFRKAMNDSLARDVRFWLERLKEAAEGKV